MLADAEAGDAIWSLATQWACVGPDVGDNVGLYLFIQNECGPVSGSMMRIATVLAIGIVLGAPACLEFEPFDYTILCPNGQRVPGPSNCEFDTEVATDAAGETTADVPNEVAPDAPDIADVTPDGPSDIADTSDAEVDASDAQVNETSDAEVVETLDAEIEATPTCNGGLCFTSVWDAASQKCIDTPTNEGGTCDDGLACTDGDACVAGQCAGTSLACDDFVACTDDSCSEDTGCVNTPTGTCQCQQDTDCTASVDPCATVVCNSLFVCAPQPLSDVACDDGNACTEGDLCENGTCEPGPLKDCTDTYSCTDDFCSDEAGVATCNNPIFGVNCLVGDTCYEHGPAPENHCLACTSNSNDTLEVSAGGTTCGSNALCWDGTCHENTALVPAGDVAVGCNDTFATCEFEVVPQTLVSVASFLVERTEVSVAQYRTCILAGNCTTPSMANGVGVSHYWETGMEDRPVNFVDWAQSLTYCQSKGMRLCSESEWEKAAAGGCELYSTDCLAQTNPYPWGAAFDCTKAVLDPTGCGVSSVGTVGIPVEGASPYQVLNMAGNLREWVADQWNSDHNSLPTDGTPAAGSSTLHVSKGKAWNGGPNPTNWLRAAQIAEAQDVGAPTIGFRCCVGGAF